MAILTHDTITVIVDTADFDIATQTNALRQPNMGAIASFVGTVRDKTGNLNALTLEHYPEMTEKCLLKIGRDAFDEFKLGGVRIYHRVGTMKPSDNIVCVLASSPHREDSINAINYIMDYLKTDAPFWKSETYTDTKKTKWIAQRQSDIETQKKWK